LYFFGAGIAGVLPGFDVSIKPGAEQTASETRKCGAVWCGPLQSTRPGDIFRGEVALLPAVTTSRVWKGS
jgi:hypothetical protein